MRDWRRDTSPPVLYPLKGRRPPSSPMFLPLFAKHEHSCFEGIDAYEEGIDAYEEEIAQDGNIIEVDFEIGLDADE